MGGPASPAGGSAPLLHLRCPLTASRPCIPVPSCRQDVDRHVRRPHAAQLHHRRQGLPLLPALRLVWGGALRGGSVSPEGRRASKAGAAAKLAVHCALALALVPPACRRGAPPSSPSIAALPAGSPSAATWLVPSHADWRHHQPRGRHSGVQAAGPLERVPGCRCAGSVVAWLLACLFACWLALPGLKARVCLCVCAACAAPGSCCGGRLPCKLAPSDCSTGRPRLRISNPAAAPTPLRRSQVR